MKQRRAVIVTRPTELELLLERHGTRGQAAFHLTSRGGRLEEVEERHHVTMAAVARVSGAIPLSFRRARVKRSELDRFLFEPEDVVFAVGQDGLVANVAKYLTGQVVVGLNPSRALFDGVLVRKSLDDLGRLFGELEAGDPPVEERAMVSARTANGSAIVALNEVFIGHVGHQSARYVLRRRGSSSADEKEAAERQSSSGLIVSTGTGATGWASSVARERKGDVSLPAVGSTDLVFFVREAFASVRTGTSLTHGVLRPGESIEVRWEMEDGVVFGDGIEKDRLALSFGEVVTVARAETRLRLAL